MLFEMLQQIDARNLRDGHHVGEARPVLPLDFGAVPDLRQFEEPTLPGLASVFPVTFCRHVIVVEEPRHSVFTQVKVDGCARSRAHQQPA